MSSICTVEYIAELQETWERCYKQNSLTAFMENNGSDNLIKYIGDKNYQYQDIAVTGLGNYPAPCEPFPNGGITITNNVLSLGFRRAVEFCFDRKENDDTYGLLTAENVYTQLLYDWIIPEVDAYRFSRMWWYANSVGNVTSGKNYVDAGGNLVGDAEDVAKDFRMDVMRIISGMKNTGQLSRTELVAYVRVPVKFALDESGASCHCGAITTANGEQTMTVNLTGINGTELREVGENLFHTKFVYGSGAGDVCANPLLAGFHPDPTAKQINWLIFKKTAPIARRRYDDLNIIDPMTNQVSRAWKVQYDLFHDMWFDKCNMELLWANTQ